jgi:hypothetical protein
MRRVFLIPIFLLTCLGLLTTVVKMQTSDLPVTTTVKDYLDVVDSSGSSQRLLMQIRSDNAGAYQNSKSVQSIIQATAGDWVLDTNYSKVSTRSVFLDFSKPVVGSGPNGGAPAPPFNAALVKPRIISKCHEYGNRMFTIPYAVTVNCPFAITFSYGSGSYRIQMTPDNRTVYAYPETDFVNITCAGVNASLQCNSWKIEPNGAKGGCVTADCSVRQNVGKLVKLVTSKGQTTEVNQGDFYIAFSIGLTHP